MISSSRLLPLRTTTWLCRVRLPLQTFNNRSDSQPPPQHQIFIHQSPGWHLSQLDTRWYSRWSFVKQTVKNNKEHTTTHDNIIPANLKHSETFLKNTFSLGHISSPNECGDMRSGIWMDYFLHTYLLLTLCRNRKQSNFLLRPRSVMRNWYNNMYRVSSFQFGPGQRLRHVTRARTRLDGSSKQDFLCLNISIEV